MFQKILFFLRLTLTWIVVLGSISLIGFVLYPLLSEKYNSMALRNNRVNTGKWNVKSWYPLEIEREKIVSWEIQKIFPTKEKPQIDTLEQMGSENIQRRVDNFLETLQEAFLTNTNKETVLYTKDENGVYRTP